MRSGQNEIISFCVDSRHTLFYFICVDGIRSVLNDTHFCAMIYDIIIFKCFDF